MRTALLSSLELSEGGPPRALLRLGGRSILAWQVALVRSLGCKRILCLCNPELPEIVQIQKDIEAGGGEFHGVRNPIQVGSLVRRGDQLVVIADGILIDPMFAQSDLHTRNPLTPTIYTVASDHPAASGHEEVFERIDASRLWAGLMVVEGDAAGRLKDGPHDGSAISLLLRIALQSGTKTTPLAPDVFDRGEWLLVDREETAARREDDLIRQASPRDRWVAPMRMLAGFMARGVATRTFDLKPAFAASAAIIAVAIAIALAFWDFSVLSLSVAALGTFVAEVASASRILRQRVLGVTNYANRIDYFSGMIDILVIMVLLFLLHSTQPAVMALPVFSWGLARLASVRSGPRLAPFWNDRTVHLAVFAICAAYGLLEEALAAFGLVALIHALARVDVWKNDPGPVGSGTRR